MRIPFDFAIFAIFKFNSGSLVAIDTKKAFSNQFLTFLSVIFSEINLIFFCSESSCNVGVNDLLITVTLPPALMNFITRRSLTFPPPITKIFLFLMSRITGNS